MTSPRIHTTDLVGDRFEARPRRDAAPGGRHLRAKDRRRRAPAGLRLESLERRELLAAFQVINTLDAGAGSLRQAILDSDGTPGANQISFAIPGAGVHTISPTTPLPAINNAAILDATMQAGYNGTPLIELNGANIFAPGVTPPTPLGGVNGLVLSGGASTVKGLAIDRFTGAGILATQNGNTIAANYIGTDPAGKMALGNAVGVELDSRANTVGGADAASGNVISGNRGAGLYLNLASAQPANNVVQRNLIGTDATGALDVGNAGAGVLVNASGNLIGSTIPAQGNTIAYNGGAGVQVGFFAGQSVNRDQILDNSIFSNAGLGIDLGGDGVTSNHFGGSNFGANNLQNFPVLTAAYTSGAGTTVEGTFNAAASTNFTISYYSSPQADQTGFGQGQTFLGSSVITTDASGFAYLTTTLPAVAVGQVISATATGGMNTSEFARSVTVASSAQSDLSVMTFNPSPTAQAGVSQTFTYQVTNTGPARATGVVFTDTLPQGATFLAGSSTLGSLAVANGVATVNVGTLSSGVSAQISLTYFLATPGPVVNTATVKADQADPVSQNNTVTQNFQVTPAPPVDLFVFGSAAAFPPQVNSDLTYTFVVNNLYQFNSATGVTLTDPLPAGLAYVSATTTQGTVSQANGVVTASLGKLDPSSRAIVTIVTRPTGAGVISNTATVTANEPDPNPFNNQSNVTIGIAAAPQVDLFAQITAAPQPAVAGQGLTYVVLVGNSGNAQATDVVLTDLLPAGVTVGSIKPSQGTATQSGNVLTVALGTLAPGATAAVTIVVTPGLTGSITDQASVTADQPDLNIGNNFNTSTITVLAAPGAFPVDLFLFGSAAAYPPQVGGDLTYTFVVNNLYQYNAATGVTLTDPLPAGLAFVSASTSQGTVALVNGVVTASLGTLGPFTRATVTVVTRPTAPGLLVNSATVTADEPDPDPTNNQATVTVQVGPAPQADLYALVTTAPLPAAVGRPITYVVLVGNNGTAPATNVVLTDLLPIAGAVASIKPSQGTATLFGNVITAALGTIAPGATAALTIVLIPGAPGFVIDQAAVSADQPDLYIADNYSILATPVLVSSTGPSVLNQRLIIDRNAITGIVLTFNKDLDPTLAANPANYRILDLGGGRSAAANGPPIAIAGATYDPITRSVTVFPSRALAVGRYYRFTANGEGAPGIVDTTGSALQALEGGPQDSIYTLLIVRGTAVRPVPVQVGVPTPNLSAGNQTTHKTRGHVVKAPRVQVVTHATAVKHATRAGKHG